jgi:hypothetical protein
MSNTIKGAHVFSVGTWNRKKFTSADLDAMVDTFKRTGQAGRVPLKLGHDDVPLGDGAPALGWVSALWRDGDKLRADFSDVPTVIYNAIRAGNYKFVSIEILQDAKTADGQTFPWALDAIALLGSDPPAVKDLESLQKLAASRELLAMSFGHRATFKEKFLAPDGMMTAEQLSELETLRAENVQFKAGAEHEKAEREKFAREKAEQALKMHLTERVAHLEKLVLAGKLSPGDRDVLLETVMKTPESAHAFTRELEEVFLKVADKSRFTLHMSRGSTARDEKGVKGEAVESGLTEETPAGRLIARSAEIRRAAFARGEIIDRFKSMEMAVMEEGNTMLNVMVQDAELMGRPWGSKVRAKLPS